MGRTAAGNDVKLLHAGLRLARAKGLGGFTVREVCALCQVNLGMFHYYFTNKDNFDRALLSTLYENLMKNIRLEVSEKQSPRENVLNILLAIQRFVRENRRLLSSLAGDVFSGNAKIIDFIGRNFTHHISLLLAQLERAEKEGVLVLKDAANAALVLAMPVVFPQLVAGLDERVPLPWKGRVRPSVAVLFADKGAEERIKVLVNAVFKGDK